MFSFNFNNLTPRTKIPLWCLQTIMNEQAFLSSFSNHIFFSPAHLPQEQCMFQEMWQGCEIVSSVFWRKLLEILLDPEVRGPVISTQTFSEKNSGFREWTPTWNHNTRKQRILSEVKAKVLQNSVCPGIFTGGKGLWHVISGKQICQCSWWWY